MVRVPALPGGGGDVKREWVAIFSSICNAKRMRALPDNTCRLLFVLLATQCDSHGRLDDDADSVWAGCWATFGPTCSQDETVRALGELERVGLIERHATEEARWIQVPDWEEKAGRVGERAKRGASKFPEPSPDTLATKSRHTRESVGNKSATEREESRGEKREKRAEGERVPRSPQDPWDPVFASHPGMDTPECRAACIRWDTYRRELGNGKKLTPTGRASTLTQYATRGPADLIAAIDNTITKGVQGLLDPEPARNGAATNGRAATNSGRRADGTRAGELPYAGGEPRVI